VTKYPAYDAEGNPLVLHVFNPERVSQSRGVSAFIRLIENATAHADLQFAMLIKEQAAACLTILRETESSNSGMPLGGAAALGPAETVPNADGTSTTVHELRPGLEIAGRPGEKLSINAPNLPGDGFLKHSAQVLAFIAVNLGIPYQVLLLDPTQSNFSSWRGAMDVAQHGFAAIRAWMITQFYTPVYEWWLRGEIAENPEFARLYDELGEDIFGHQWTPPYDPYIEPSKDISAETNQVSARLDSRRNVLARRGLDLDDVDLDIVTDQVTLLRLCCQGAQTLATEFPEAGITWRDVYQVGMVQGSPPAVAVESPDPPDDGEEDPTTKSTKEKERKAV
jgi:capsid protein